MAKFPIFGLFCKDDWKLAHIKRIEKLRALICFSKHRLLYCRFSLMLRNDGIRQTSQTDVCSFDEFIGTVNFGYTITICEAADFRKSVSENAYIPTAFT